MEVRIGQFLLNYNIYINLVQGGQNYSNSRAKISSACHASGRAIAGVALWMREEWQVYQMCKHLFCLSPVSTTSTGLKVGKINACTVGFCKNLRHPCFRVRKSRNIAPIRTSFIYVIIKKFKLNIPCHCHTLLKTHSINCPLRLAGLIWIAG